MPDLDHLLRERLRAHTPATPPPFDQVRAAAVRRRRRRVAVAAVAAGLVVTGGGVAAAQWASGPADDSSLVSEPGADPSGEPGASPTGPARRGPLGQGGTSSASCIEEYTPRAVTERAFAFDGVVTAIGPSVTDGGGEADLDYAGVTFRVERWYAGGSADTVTVDLPPPAEQQVRSDDFDPTYGIGTRLLVSGESRWGGDDPLAAPLGWTCGFTRYYDEATAAAWADAFANAS